MEKSKETFVEIFYHLSQLVKNNYSSTELLGFVVQAATNLLHTHSGGIVLLDKGRLQVRAKRGLSKEFDQSIPLGEGILGRVVQERKTYNISNLQADPRNVHTVMEEEEGLHSLLVVPLYSEEKTYGAIFIYSPIPDFFHRQDEQLLQALANYTVFLFQQADLYQEMERRLAELSTLHRASQVITSSLDLEEVVEMSLDTLMGIIGIRECALVLFQEEGEIQDLIMGKTLTTPEKERILSELKDRDWEQLAGQVVAVDPETEAKTFLEKKRDERSITGHLFLPLKSRNRVLGSLVILNQSRIPLLEFNTLDFLLAFVNHVSTACQNARFYQRVNKLAQRDAMVNLYNHSYLQNALSQLIERAQAEKEPLSLLLLDIDHFKQVNDTYGHLTGDAVLKLLANILRKNTRGDDLVARYGGEEFVLVLPKAERERATMIAERLRRQVENYIFRHEGDCIRITISIGVAILQDTMKKKDLITAADTALYSSKQKGRNQVTVFEEEET